QDGTPAWWGLGDDSRALCHRDPTCAKAGHLPPLSYKAATDGQPDARRAAPLSDQASLAPPLVWSRRPVQENRRGRSGALVASDLSRPPGQTHREHLCEAHADRGDLSRYQEPAIWLVPQVCPQPVCCSTQRSAAIR